MWNIRQRSGRSYILYVGHLIRYYILAVLVVQMGQIDMRRIYTVFYFIIRKDNMENYIRIQFIYPNIYAKTRISTLDYVHKLLFIAVTRQLRLVCLHNIHLFRDLWVD